MLEAGIISPSQSSYSALVVMVPNLDRSWCMCPNYRELNNITIKYKFPIPDIDELLDNYMEKFPSQSWIFVLGIIRFK